jgi:peptide deformylase
LIIKNNKERLRRVCEPVSNILEGEDIAIKLFNELGDKGIGLAANQIGINKRVCIINVKEPITFINPEITKLDGEVIVPESCLSFPKKVVNTKRAQWVTVESDNHGTVVLGSDSDDENLLEGVCAQHEIDHLDGITMYERKFIRKPIKRMTKKIGRNEKVTIEKDGKEKIVKWKKAQSFFSDGWTLL